MSTMISTAVAPALRPRVVIQGVRGAFHEIAARQFFGQTLEVVPALSFEALVDSAGNPAVADRAIMAIENSIAGSILNNYNLLQNNNLHIIGEVFLPIRQNLMALPGVTLADLREVHSHPMALMQCSVFLRRQSSWRLLESEDTAESAAMIAREQARHIAAIGSTLAAELYGLHVLAPAIEDNPQNYTRFLALAPAGAVPVSAQANKASVRFTISHQPGSLSKILSALAAESGNLTKIQSVPIQGRPWEYQFFADFTVRNPAVMPAALQLLDALSVDFKVLGVYEAAEM